MSRLFEIVEAEFVEIVINGASYPILDQFANRTKKILAIKQVNFLMSGI